jgi:hypothetical protein
MNLPCQLGAEILEVPHHPVAAGLALEFSLQQPVVHLRYLYPPEDHT